MSNDTLMLTLPWKTLEEELHRLAAGPIQAEMIPHLVRPLQMQARFLSQALILREVVSIAACIANTGFPPEQDLGF